MTSDESRNMAGCQFYHRRDLPYDWDCVPLEERIELRYGSGLREEDRTPGDVPVYGSNGVVGTHTESFVEGPGILVGRKGTVGAVHYSAEAYWPIDTVYYVNPIANDNLRFIYYLLQHLPLGFLNAATGVPGLSRRDAYALRGAFPPPAEQSAIAQILDAADTAIERTRAAVARAREVKKSLIQQLFAHGMRGEQFKKTRIGLIPISWEVVPVEAVTLKFEYGLSVPMQLQGEMPILRMGNIQQGNVILEDLKYVTLPPNLIAPYLAQRGDVFFNRTNSQEHVGKVGIYRSDEPSVFASYLIRVVPNPEVINSYFLGQLLNSYGCQCRIKRYATPGVQQVNINATNLGKVLIPLPAGISGIKEQEEIATILEKADECIHVRQPLLEKQLVLKQSLMHDLLSGIKRVNTVGIAEQLELF